MEPGPRRRRRSLPLVASFLRDPGSGRVYRRGKLIGKGAFSRCYKLTDMSTSAEFALKVVPRGGGGAGRLCPRGKVEHEIALHSRLRHRNIVAFHGHFADNDHVYMVLEYCSRQSLAHVLKARQTLTEPEVRYYLRGLVSGLHYLHQRRIVHRDLKLSNFFLNKNMEVKIGDLGLAARVGPGGRCHRVLCGTPNFLAPEVVSRNGHSCQSDIWALGCVMYLVLTGDPPFTAAPLSEMYQNIREGRYPEPAHLSPNARSLIARLLAPNPAERPSLDHLLQDDFFTQGFTPAQLPPHSCHSPPIFVIAQPLGRLFRKVGQQLLTQCRPPCPFTPKETPGPGEGGPEPDPMEWSSASLSERGAPCPEAPIQLLTQGTLRCDPKGSKESRPPEVEAAICGLQLCLDAGPPAVQDPPGEQRPLLWAPKWLDYSSKYGFGYQLSDGGSGVLLRDGTHMALHPPGGQVCYASDRGKLEMFALRDVPGALGAKLAVLRLFTRHLQLREEGTLPAPAPPAGPSLCLLRFLVFDQASMLLFSNGTVQVSCSGEQAQLVLSGEGEDLLLTLWEQGRPGTSYPLGVLRSHGCTPTTRQRLHHALCMLQSI
ncbi:inactive serine/threonine-protein kinase PLK5 [Trichechus inunguis]